MSYFLEVFFAAGILVCVAVAIIALLLVGLTLDRRLKIEFECHPEIITQTSLYFRLICIALNVVFNGRSSNDRVMHYHYQGFDFRGFASPLEKALCFTYVYCGLTGIIIGFLSFPAEYFGFIDFGLFD